MFSQIIHNLLLSGLWENPARASLGLPAASNGQILHFIINGFAGHVGNFYISIHLIINGSPELWQPSVAHNAL